MNIKKPVQPNFIKALVLTSLSIFSVSAFAAHHEGAEEKASEKADMVKSLEAQDMDAKVEKELTADELKIKMDDEKAKAEMKKMMAKDSKKKPELQ